MLRAAYAYCTPYRTCDWAAAPDGRAEQSHGRRGVCLRLVYGGWVELMPEETYYWNYARHLDIGYLDHHRWSRG